MGQFEIVRFEGKEELPELEDVIGAIAQQVVRVKGPFRRPIVYDSLDQHPDLMDKWGEVGTYLWKKDMIAIANPEGNIGKTGYPNLKIAVAMFRNLISKSNADFRYSHDKPKTGLNNLWREVLREGDRHRHLPEFIARQGSVYLGDEVDELVRANLMADLNVLNFRTSLTKAWQGYRKKNANDFFCGVHGLTTITGLKYCDRLDKLGGEDLIKYAFIHPHGNCLDFPGKLHRAYQQWLEQTI